MHILAVLGTRNEFWGACFSCDFSILSRTRGVPRHQPSSGAGMAGVEPRRVARHAALSCANPSRRVLTRDRVGAFQGSRDGE